MEIRFSENEIKREVLVTSKKQKGIDIIKEKQDLIKLHIIRGRMLHLSTIIETLIKDDIVGFRAKKREPYYERFIRKLESNPRLNKNRDFKKFRKSLRRFCKERNNWAHGITFYKKRGRKFPSKPNNSLFNRGTGKKIDISANKSPTYFDKLNMDLGIVINWLNLHGYLKLKKLNLVFGHD